MAIEIRVIVRCISSESEISLVFCMRKFVNFLAVLDILWRLIQYQKYYRPKLDNTKDIQGCDKEYLQQI